MRNVAVSRVTRWRRIAVASSASLAVVFAVTGPTVAAPGPKSPLKLTSITPQVAQHGELVTVTGEGFGGKNVVITVGGERVPVLDATGSRASFRVPLLAQVGRVTVRLTNPGGHVGEIELMVPFDGNATAVLDRAQAASATIGRAGRSLVADGVTLAVPVGALSEDVLITMTPLTDLADSPLQGLLIGGVKLEP